MITVHPVRSMNAIDQMVHFSLDHRGDPEWLCFKVNFALRNISQA